MIVDNEMTIKLKSNSENESVARTGVSAFVLAVYPKISVGDLSDIKTAVSEAVTNSIIHGYPETKGEIYIKCTSVGELFCVEVKDDGVGIEDIEKAMMPMQTSRPEMERSGLGFTVMENFMDKINVKSKLGEGTAVKMWKKILPTENKENESTSKEQTSNIIL